MPTFCSTRPDAGFLRKCRLLARLKAGLMGRDPGLGHTVFVRVRNIERGVRDRLVARKALHVLGVRQHEGSQQQPLRFQVSDHEGPT